MKIKPDLIPFLAMCVVIILALACVLPGAVPTALPAETTVPQVILPTTPSVVSPTTTSLPVTTTPTVPEATQTPTPLTPTIEMDATAIPTDVLLGPPTEIPPTPVFGKPIPHLAVGQKIIISRIQMLDSANGWGIGHVGNASDHVLHTHDGGNTWQDVTPPETAPAAGERLLASGAFGDVSSAWVVYIKDGILPPPQPVVIWYTTDGGSSWKYGLLDTSGSIFEFFLPSDMVFADALHGWLLVHVGAGMMHDYVSIAATTDGGASWHFILDPTNPNYNLGCAKNGMAFVDSQNGWLSVDCNGVDLQPYLYRTSNGGLSWIELQIPAPPGTSDFYNNYACGTYYPTIFSVDSAIFAMRCRDISTYKSEEDYLYRTGDRGDTWQVTSMPTDFKIPDTGGGLYFPNEQTGLALSRSFFKTEDGGQNWTPVRKVNWDAQFSFVDLDNGWAAAFNAGQYALVKITNSGKSLSMINPVVGP